MPVRAWRITQRNEDSRDLVHEVPEEQDPGRIKDGVIHVTFW